ncbi:TetR/AcrR family transcriptional regulator [Microbacterium protaetiae]|uniref:TetR/AcrR family transcriptional regulator n=1 Tax=Microbacterium protaetiae TaxID=2509458 RepID=A0A4P6EP82_9MICO|nr:TetR/AcrR family transcriptional regulator [Microbacterium protaetiae]QAY59758.1 TetR/AcrR family transcriptional regulator [Microbacterium protaetiae]
MSTPHPPRRKDAAQNRAGILVAAVTVLADDPHASIDTIAKAAGLSRRAFYGHFEDRGALITAVIAEGAERFNAIAQSVTDDDPRSALAHLARGLWGEAQHVHAAVAVALNDKLARLTAQALAPVRVRLLEICERGFERDVLRRDIPPAVTVRLVEEAARSVITHLDPAQTRGHHLAERAVLSAAGLGWQQIDDLIIEGEKA